MARSVAWTVFSLTLITIEIVKNDAMIQAGAISMQNLADNYNVLDMSRLVEATGISTHFWQRLAQY